MFCELYDIERLCTRIPGGLKQVVLIDPADLESQPVWYDVPNVAELEFKPGKTPYRFDCDRQNSRLTDRVSTTDAGDVVEYTLSCTVRGIRLDVDLLRKRLINRRIHVVATYGNGYQRFLPWVRLLGESDSGDRPAARNQYSFTGSTRLATIAPGVDAALTPPSSGGGGEGGGDAMEPVLITTSNSTYTYEVPAGKLLDAIVIAGNTSQTVNIGTSANGDEITSELTVDANSHARLGSVLLYAPTATNIYFSGLSGANTIKLYIW